MNSDSPKKEMQQIIRECITSHSYQTAAECLSIYQKTFGQDEFHSECELTLICEDGPSVSLICIDSDADSVNNFIKQQQYKNLDVFYIPSADRINDILAYIQSAGSKFVCFFEPNHKYSALKLATMVSLINHIPEADGILCSRNFIDADDVIIAHPDICQNSLHGKAFVGAQLLILSIKHNINLYGNLSTVLLRTQHIKQVLFNFSGIPSSMYTLALFHQLISQATIYFANLPLVSTLLRPNDNSSYLEEDYKKYLEIFLSDNEIKTSAMEKLNRHKQDCISPIQKNITLFYTDKGEYYNVKPIAEEAKRRGYQVSFTEDIYQKAEIGIYCQHVCYPENSKFSVN